MQKAIPMAVFLVTYDLNNEDVRPKIVKHLKAAFGTWARLSESSYAIKTDGSASDVFRHFEPLLDGDDQLYVISLKKPYAGQGSSQVNDWLANNLTY